jgi:Zn-finger nucleic acid-binding protein
MEEFLQAGTYLDRCNQCQGHFFDQGEMFATLGKHADPSYWDRPETGGVSLPGGVPCPRCTAETLLQDVAFGGERVEIDRCGSCGGIFLDGGEATKIVAIGAKMAEVVAAERNKAQIELAKMGDVDFRAGGMIHSFLAMFSRKKS